MDKLYDSETGCCPRFDPEPWDEKEHVFEDRLFIKDRVTSVFHIPLNFGKVIVRNMEKIAKAEALTPEPFFLSDECSLWGSDLYIEVTKEIVDSQMERISGTFVTKVFDGPYKNIRNWVKEMDGYLESQSKQLKKLYFYYTTCPKCAKHYGKNYVVLVAQV